MMPSCPREAEVEIAVDVLVFSDGPRKIKFAFLCFVFFACFEWPHTQCERNQNVNAGNQCAPVTANKDGSNPTLPPLSTSITG